MPPPLVEPPRPRVAGGGGRQETVHSRLRVSLLVPGFAHDDAAAWPEGTYEVVRVQEIGIGCIVGIKKDSLFNSPVVRDVRIFLSAANPLFIINHNRS